MRKADKDGSGEIDQIEFIALMCDIIKKRDSYQEMKKIFKYYDNDDDGKIDVNNLRDSAYLFDMEDDCDQESLEMMISMADPNNLGFVNQNAFLDLMRELGLIIEYNPGDSQIGSALPLKDSDMEIEAE